MKKVNTMKRWALGAMLIMIAATTFAGERNKGLGNLAIFPYLNTDYSVVSFSNLVNKNAKFYIKNAKGDVIYKDWVNKEGFYQKVLDFSNLENGEYTALLTTKGASDITKTFLVEDQKTGKQQGN